MGFPRASKNHDFKPHNSHLHTLNSRSFLHSQKTRSITFIYPFLTILKLLRRHAHTWLLGYLRHVLSTARHTHLLPEHVILVVADHFEPPRKSSNSLQRVTSWCAEYEQLSRKFLGSDSVSPRHTWFYRYDYPNADIVRCLANSAFRGFGEIEFHLHHAFDTPENFSSTLTKGLAWFNTLGAMLTCDRNPQQRFAYIAGNWALDNGRKNPKYSGVNTELSILREAGCYADFTFPAFGTTAQPFQVNSIFYATDTPRPKSYSTGTQVCVGSQPVGDLLIFQGPLFIDWWSAYIEYSAIEASTPYESFRLPYWLKANIHVLGQPNWVFIKLHTHGVQSASCLFLSLSKLFSDLQACQTKGYFQVHYAVAREAYNMVRAAIDGKSGSPHLYRDYIIPPPANTKISANVPYNLVSYCDREIFLRLLNTGTESRVTLSFPFPIALEGPNIQSIRVLLGDSCFPRLEVQGQGPVRIYGCVCRPTPPLLANHNGVAVNLPLLSEIQPCRPNEPDP